MRYQAQTELKTYYKHYLYLTKKEDQDFRKLLLKALKTDYGLSEDDFSYIKEKVMNPSNKMRIKISVGDTEKEFAVEIEEEDEQE